MSADPALERFLRENGCLGLLNGLVAEFGILTLNGLLGYTDDEIKDEILSEISSTSPTGEKKEKLKLRAAVRKQRQRRTKVAEERWAREAEATQLDRERKANAAKEERLLNTLKPAFYDAQTRELRR